MIKEDELLNRPRIQFAIFSEHQIYVGLAVRLTSSIQPVDVRRELHRARDCAGHGRQEREVNGQPFSASAFANRGDLPGYARL